MREAQQQATNLSGAEEFKFLEAYDCIDPSELHDEALRNMDAMLQEFGLEVITANRNDDCIWYRIGKRAPKIQDVEPEQLMKVYSGKPGCGCGCRGIYRINPAMVEAATKERGYEYSEEEINFTTVKRVLKTMQARADEVKVDTGEDMVIYAIEDDKRYYWAYLPM